MTAVEGNAYDILIPNFFYGGFEMDLFKIAHLTGYVTEYEIKISKADFKKDFSKGKTFMRHPEYNSNKHLDMAAGKCKHNKFFFVVPENLVKVEDIPNYAGLIYFNAKHNTFTTIKTAPFIHKNKAEESVYRELARSLCFREKIWRGKVRWYSFQLKLKEPKI